MKSETTINNIKTFPASNVTYNLYNSIEKQTSVTGKNYKHLKMYNKLVA